jgi:hypothetical protein
MSNAAAKYSLLVRWQNADASIHHTNAAGAADRVRLLRISVPGCSWIYNHTCGSLRLAVLGACRRRSRQQRRMVTFASVVE